MNDIKGIIEDVEKSSLVSNKVIKKVIKIIGQEEWNNIYDEESDICTTTGELIITLKGIAELEKENAKLKEKISVLLSCKNCSENKGGWGCEKEYENKCLTQKIVYIKELKEENAELDCQMNRNKYCYSCVNATDRCFRNEIGCPCEKYKSYKDLNKQLTKAKELLTKWVELFKPKGGNIPPTPIQVETEQFLRELEE